MKYLFFTLIIFLSLGQVSTNKAYSLTGRSIIRNDRFKAKEENVLFKDLLNQHEFNGKYFKIVHGKNEQAISFSEEDEDLLLKAGTVYHHLTLAKDYFKRHFNLVSDHQLVIRLDIQNQFSELGHFAHDNRSPEFNNSLSIPAGEGLSGKDLEPWHKEIWFRPSKKIHRREINFDESEGQKIKATSKMFRNKVHMVNFQRSLIYGVQHYSGVDVSTGLIYVAGTSLFTELIYQGMPLFYKISSPRFYYFESALIPEVIYHEYAHIMLSGWLDLSHANPVVEGMADYFAAMISGNPYIAKKIKKYSKFEGKDAKKKQTYNVQLELPEYAYSDFVLHLLWYLNDFFDSKEKALDFALSLSKRLERNSNIRVDLVQALLDECNVSCKNPKVDRLILLNFFQSRGI